MELIGMYAAFTATANNQASLQIPRRGILRGIQWTIIADLDADLEEGVVELSKVPVFQSTTNNTRNLILAVATHMALTTSGAMNTVRDGFCPMNLALSPIEILYVNGVLTGTQDVRVLFLLHFD